MEAEVRNTGISVASGIPSIVYGHGQRSLRLIVPKIACTSEVQLLEFGVELAWPVDAWGLEILKFSYEHLVLGLGFV